MTAPSPRDAAALLANVRVVLCRTSHPGNIGACARAMKTMGLARLHLVQPARFPDVEADAMASRATDVLEAATLNATLAEALAGTTFAVASTARMRDLSHPVLTPREAAARLVHEAAAAPVALVFGAERTGLSAEQVSRCNVISTIPANPAYSSLNLAAAVQIFAYEVQLAATGVESLPEELPPAASHEELERFYAHLEQTMVDTGFLDPDKPKRLMQRMRRLFGRARLEKEEVNILRGILAAARQGRARPS
jgi:TrmH family RNA methyltransferase